MPKRKCVFNDRLKESFKSFVDGRVTLVKPNVLSVIAMFQFPIKVYFPSTNLYILNSLIMLSNFTFLTGSYDLKAHLNTTKHKSRIASSAVSSSNNLDHFVMNKNTLDILKVGAVEGTLAFHTVVHHHSYRLMDCTPAILRCMFDDSNVPCVKIIFCTYHKTKHLKHY